MFKFLLEHYYDDFSNLIILNKNTTYISWVFIIPTFFFIRLIYTNSKIYDMGTLVVGLLILLFYFLFYLSSQDYEFLLLFYWWYFFFFFYIYWSFFFIGLYILIPLLLVMFFETEKIEFYYNFAENFRYTVLKKFVNKNNNKKALKLFLDNNYVYYNKFIRFSLIIVSILFFYIIVINWKYIITYTPIHGILYFYIKKDKIKIFFFFIFFIKILINSIFFKSFYSKNIISFLNLSGIGEVWDRWMFCESFESAIALLDRICAADEVGIYTLLHYLDDLNHPLYKGLRTTGHYRFKKNRFYLSLEFISYKSYVFDSYCCNFILYFLNFFFFVFFTWRDIHPFKYHYREIEFNLPKYL